MCDMRPEWPSQAYDLLDNNCHHYSAAAAEVLGVRAVPRWVNRTGEILRLISGAGPADQPLRPSASNHTAGVAEGSLKQGDQELECEPLLASSRRLHLP